MKKKIKGSKNTFSYLEYGATTAPTLLLVHGFSSSKESFFGVFKHIPRKFHVLAVDLPGHGETPLKDTDIGILHFVECVNEVFQIFLNQIVLFYLWERFIFQFHCKTNSNQILPLCNRFIELSWYHYNTKFKLLLFVGPFLVILILSNTLKHIIVYRRKNSSFLFHASL